LSLNSRSSPSSGTLELPALGAHAGSSVRSLLAGVETEVPLGLSVPGASQQQHALAGGGELGELVEGVGVASSSDDALAGSSGELEGGDVESLGHVEQSDVVGDGADDGHDSGVVLGLALGDGSAILTEMSGNSRDGNGVSVQSRLVEALVDHLVELGLGPAGEEGVELHYRSCTLMRLLR
jgi:hypothetical protein